MPITSEQTKRHRANILSSANASATAEPNASEAQGTQLVQLYGQVSKEMYGFTTGNPQSDTTFCAVVDLMCPHCANVWMQSQTLLDRFHFMWLPVPMLNADSMTNGALILASTNPAEAMNVHEHKLLSKLPPLNPVPALLEQGTPKMQHNKRIAQALRLDAVPLVLTRRRSGEVVMMVGGIGAPEILALAGAGQ